MNPTNPTQSHSPLLPQGSIPPKNTSRSSQVLLIAATVVFFHVAGFAVVLMQGCQKDAKTAGSTNIETNGTSNLSLPPMADSSSMFSTNTGSPTISTGAPATAANVYTPPTSSAPSFASQPPTNITPQPGFVEPPTSALVAHVAETPMTDYKIAPRDTLSVIARKHHITLAALKAANPNVDPAKLQVGKTLKIPAVPLPAGETGAVPAAASASPGPSAISSGTTTGNAVYVVRSGDTLTKIARNNGITVGQLRAANNMKTTRVLVGQKLKIPARTTAAAPTATTPQ